MSTYSGDTVLVFSWFANLGPATWFHRSALIKILDTFYWFSWIAYILWYLRKLFGKVCIEKRIQIRNSLHFCSLLSDPSVTQVKEFYANNLKFCSSRLQKSMFPRKSLLKSTLKLPHSSRGWRKRRRTVMKMRRMMWRWGSNQSQGH